MGGAGGGAGSGCGCLALVGIPGSTNPKIRLDLFYITITLNTSDFYKLHLVF